MEEWTSLCILWAGRVNIKVHQVLGILMSASSFTLMGIIIGSYVKNSNQFLIWCVVVCIPLGIPVIAFYFGNWGNWLSMIPTYALLHLMSAKVINVSVLVDFTSLSLWCVGMYFIAKMSVREYIFVR